MNTIKKGVKLLLPILLIAVFSSSVFALSFKSDKVEVQRLSFIMNSESQFFVKVNNMLDKELDEVKISVMVPELGLRSASKNFDLDDKSSFTGSVLLEDNLKGYYARIVVSNDKIRRVKHRLIT